MSVTKQKSSAGKNVFVFFFVFIILEMLIIFGVSKLFKNKDSVVSLAGYSFYIMDSSDMGDQIPKSTVVVTSEGSPSKEDRGKAVLCKNVEGVGTSVFWLSDVVSEKEGQDGVVYKVYQSSDKTKFYDVKSDNIVGVSSTHLESLGKVIVFVKSKFGMIVCAGVPLFLLVLLEIIIAIVTRSPKEDYNDDEEEEQEQQEVQLDDFLFGGKDEGEQIAKRKKMLESRQAEEEKKEKALVAAGSVKTEESKTEKTEATESEENVENNDEGSDIDRSYYEKASKFLDDGEDAAEETEPAVEIKTKRKKPATASLEDLMKLMEDEQNKLKKQLNKED